MSDTKRLNVLIAKALLLNQYITDSEQVNMLTAHINGDIEKKSLSNMTTLLISRYLHFHWFLISAVN